jgi:hypothetical protein
MHTYMNTPHPQRRGRLHLLAAAAVAALAGAVVGASLDGARAVEREPTAAAVAAPGSGATASWRALENQLRLRQIVMAMPAGWPATEAMRQVADRPLGDTEARQRWSRDAARMPAGWPATEAMRRAAAETE